MIMYKVLVRLVLPYGVKSWALPNSDERDLSIFERSILYILASEEENDIWYRRFNYEWYNLYNEPN